MEQKSGYVLQTVLLEGESKGQHASPSTGGNRKRHQVSKYFKTVNSGFVEESGYVTAKSFWDPASEKPSATSCLLCSNVGALAQTTVTKGLIFKNES